MYQSPRPAWCGALGCTIRPTQRRSRCAGPISGTRPWPCQRLWSGRPCAPSAATCIRNGVRPVVSSWCVQAFSHEEEPLPAWHQRSAPHEIRTTGEPDQGCRVPGDSQGTRTTAWRQDSRVVAAPGTASAPAREEPARPVPDWMTEGGPTVTSIARDGTNLVRPHQGPVSPNNAIRSAQGRV
jgi:hypothetical protein